MNIEKMDSLEEKRIIILMSTYNGGDYLDEQLKSIYAPVSYTHLDVYKRQGLCHTAFSAGKYRKMVGNRSCEKAAGGNRSHGHSG